jgi:hypothetical protein
LLELVVLRADDLPVAVAADDGALVPDLQENDALVSTERDFVRPGDDAPAPHATHIVLDGALQLVGGGAPDLEGTVL